MDALSLPKSNDDEKAARTAAIQSATLYATQIPLETMRVSAGIFPLVRAMAEFGNQNSVSDAGVGALAARSAILGAFLNVKINAAGLKDRAVVDEILKEATELAENANQQEAEIIEIVNSKIIG